MPELQLQDVLPFLSLVGSSFEPPQPQFVARSHGLPSGVALNEIKALGSIFHLNNPVVISLSCKDGNWYCDSQALSMVSFGTSIRQALTSFEEDFCIMWEDIAQCVDEQLTPDAIAVKQELLKHVAWVESGD